MKAQRKTKAAAKGAGTLFKRQAGKTYPPDARVKAPFYLSLMRDGKRTTIALKDADGQAITDRQQAEQERSRITAPIHLKDELRRVKAVASVIQDTEERLAQAIADNEPRLSIADSWQAYLDVLKYAQRSIADRTAYMYEGYVRAFTEWMKKNHPDVKALREVTPDHAEQYAAELVDRGMTAKTFNNTTGFLKTFFRTLRKSAELLQNPFDDVEPHPKQTKSKRALTVEELKRLIDAADGEYRTLFCVGTFTGLRLYDCATLTWGEVDLDRGLIIRIPHKTMKTGKPVRVGIPSFLHQHLAQIAPEQRGGFIVPEIAALYAGDRAQYVSRKIKDVFLKAGVTITRHKEGRLRAGMEEGFHALRHSYVSLMAERGAPMAAVQAIVGHANPAMTAHYTHQTDAAALGAAKLFELTDGTEQAPKREPLPQWARELIEAQAARNWSKIRAELLTT